MTISAYAWWARRRHDIQQKDTQLKGKKLDNQHNTQLTTIITAMRNCDTDDQSLYLAG